MVTAPFSLLWLSLTRIDVGLAVRLDIAQEEYRAVRGIRVRLEELGGSQIQYSLFGLAARRLAWARRPDSGEG
jgi:hypothetical protein